METRRLVIALLFALTISGGATYVFYKRFRPRGGPKPQMMKVVASTKAQQAGVVLKAEDLTIIDWPISVPLSGSIEKVDAAMNRTLLYPLVEKQPVLEGNLAVPGAGIGLTAKIPPGMRATSVRSNEIVGVAGFLFPGSHVDVLATFHPGGDAPPLTQTILQDVEVLTAGQKIQPDPQGKAETVTVVTFLLSPEDSEKLLLASTLGTIQFVLRSGADKERPETRPISLDDLVLGQKKPPAPRLKVIAKAPPKPPDFYTVEVIHGDKRSEAKF